MADTHEVTNQAPPLVDYDVFTADAALVEGVQRHDADWAVEDLTALGRRAGTAEAQEWGRLANDYPPVLHTVDRVLYLAPGSWAIGTPDEVMTSTTLSGLYGTEIDVLRVRGRVVVVGTPDDQHVHHVENGH